MNEEQSSASEDIIESKYKERVRLFEKELELIFKTPIDKILPKRINDINPKTGIFSDTINKFATFITRLSYNMELDRNAVARFIPYKEMNKERLDGLEFYPHIEESIKKLDELDFKISNYSGELNGLILLLMEYIGIIYGEGERKYEQIRQTLLIISQTKGKKFIEIHEKSN